jgi:hypothetical protein
MTLHSLDAPAFGKVTAGFTPKFTIVYPPAFP